MRQRLCYVLLVMALLATIAGIASAVFAAPQAKKPANVIAQLADPGKITEGQLRILDTKGKETGICPLKHTKVVADVSGFVARVDVTQEFTNPSSEKIEAVYVFPLPQDSAVDRMEMTVGTRNIKGQIKKREEARQIYEEAKQSGRVASLLDQERPNIFSQSVANILPGETVRITISYVDLLKYEDGQYEFMFPMVVGPRYIPGNAAIPASGGMSPDTDKVPDASKITPPITQEGTRAGHDISIDLQINAGVPISKINSVLHDVNIDHVGDNIARVTLKDEAAIPNKDFIVRYQVAGNKVQTGLLQNTRAAGDGYFSLVLVPPMSPTPAQIVPKEMIFVIDTSGSQQGWPIEKAKETMKLCIDQMNAGDTFQMIAFSNDVLPLFDKPQPNTPENRALAQEFLTNRLGNGGTEMMKAVIAALTPSHDPQRLRIVSFMTDGYVGNDMEILDAIKKNIGSARIFPFGIGNSPNRFLLDGMADMGRGAVEYVTLQEKGDNAAQRFYDRISKPVLTDITIDWGSLPIDFVYPEKIPDLFSTKPLILKGRYAEAAEGVVTIRGRLGKSRWEQKISVSLPYQEDENKALPSLWARAKIADLTARDYLGIQRGTPDPKLKEEITQVALDYQLMSQFTSFVAVEETIVTEGGQPKKVVVPVEMPEGVSYDGIFGKGVVTEKSLSRVRLSSPAPLALAASMPAHRYAVTFADSSVRALDISKQQQTLAKMKPAERQAYLVKTRLDPMLVGLAKKLDKKGNYAVKDKMKVINGSVRISVQLTDGSEASISKLKKLGFKLLANSKSMKMVIGTIPVKKLDQLAQVDVVAKIAPVEP